MALSTIPKDSIAADAIDGTKIADDAINSEHYTDGSIDTAHIGDSQVTSAKTSGVGGIVKVGNQYSTSSASTITLDGVFTSSYGIYRVIGYFILNTDSAGIELQLRNASNANFANSSDEYRSFSAGHRITSSSDTVESFTNGDYAASHWKVNFGAESNAVDAPVCLDMMFYDPLQAAVSGKNAHWRCSHHGNDAKHYYHYGAGQYTTNTGDAAGFQLAPSSGNFSRHKVTVYAFAGSNAA
jgi:hypothetical protein